MSEKTLGCSVLLAFLSLALKLSRRRHSRESYFVSLLKEGSPRRKGRWHSPISDSDWVGDDSRFYLCHPSFRLGELPSRGENGFLKVQISRCPKVRTSNCPIYYSRLRACFARFQYTSISSKLISDKDFPSLFTSSSIHWNRVMNFWLVTESADSGDRLIKRA